MYEYGSPCAPSMTGMGWANSFMGLGAAQKTALARQQAAAARKAARQLKVAGRNVSTTNPNAASQLASTMNALKAQSTAAMQKAQVSQQAFNRARQTRNPKDRQAAITANAAARAALHGALQRITTIHSGGAAATPSVRVPVLKGVRQTKSLRGLGFEDGMHMDGMGDDTTPLDQYGNPVDPNAGGYPTDPNAGYQPQQPVTGGGQYYQQPYGSGTQQVGINTGITPGFGSPFGGGGGFGIPPLTAPSGCSGNSNLPRCLIYNMAQSEQQQFYFVFSVMEQMYAQLLQIVNQLMSQAQSLQQQPPPYYGPQGPYDPNNPYGQQGPYGQPPYGQYGGSGPYGYGAPYGPDSSQIPAGFDAGGDGGGIPTDITQAFPGPGGGFNPQGVMSSDGPLPVGAGPGNDGSGGDDTGNVMAAQVPGQMPMPPQAPGQSVNMGPNQPVPIIISVQTPGQSPYADASISQAPQAVEGDGGMVTAEDW